MAIIICPECGKELSNYAKDCINCGFPIREFMNDNKLNNIDYKFICPKCAYASAGYGDESDPIYIRCKYCNTIMKQTDETGEEVLDNFIKHTEEDYFKTLAKKYGGDQFSEEAYEDRIRTVKRENSARQSTQSSKQPTNVPKCPTCGSTNIRKIGAGERTASILGLGLFSRKINKTWKCNNCGHTW